VQSQATTDEKLPKLRLPFTEVLANFLKLIRELRLFLRVAGRRPPRQCLLFHSRQPWLG